MMSRLLVKPHPHHQMSQAGNEFAAKISYNSHGEDIPLVPPNALKKSETPREVTGNKQRGKYSHLRPHYKKEVYSSSTCRGRIHAYPSSTRRGCITTYTASTRRGRIRAYTASTYRKRCEEPRSDKSITRIRLQ
ncbi:hypothetical protein PoB_004756100 [Plakobranchus ocellatus]|uniref:Uncharacterized protein n=1 Tax=Plakobranchus ocellatus TaxID=259542 RepID=A0AAV4BCG5_9GAST|nr:hypothetical protein PoB_004756100 [Plakobranchus ocellatus]